MGVFGVGVEPQFGSGAGYKLRHVREANRGVYLERFSYERGSWSSSSESVFEYFQRPRFWSRLRYSISASGISEQMYSHRLLRRVHPGTGRLRMHAGSEGT